MDARFLRDVLAQIFDGVQKDHDAIERGASAIGRGGGVGGDAVEIEAAAVVGEQGTHVDAIGIAGMPGQDGVDIVEQAGVEHIDFAAAAFFGRRAVVAEGSIDAFRLHLLFNRDGGESGGGAQQIVAAAVAGRAGVGREIARARPFARGRGGRRILPSGR